MATETEAEKRYASAYEAAVQIIYETRDGLRNEKMNRAGYHIGRFGLWPCAMPQATVVYNLTTLAISQGANRKEAERTIREGYEAGKKKDPVPLPTEKVRKVRTTETMSQLWARKRLTPEVADTYRIRETDGELRYSVDGITQERVRVLTQPSSMRWAPRLDGLVLPFPYGFRSLDGTGPVYWVNGESAVWACRAAGVDAVTSCLGESSKPTPLQVQAMAELGRPVRVVYDLDAAGERGSALTVAALVEAGVDALPLLLPATLGAKGDVGDLWVHHAPNADAFAAALAGLPRRDVVELAEPTKPEPVTGPGGLTMACPGIPAPESVGVPYGWVIDERGVVLPHASDPEKDKIVCRTPLAIVARTRDRKGKKMSCTLAYWLPVEERWETIEEDRQTLMEARKVSGLSAYGIPVTSGEGALLVQYMAASDAALDEARIPVTSTVKTMGWHDGAFLRGFHRHGADCPRLRLDDRAGAALIIAEAIGDRGEWSEWVTHVWPSVRRFLVLRVAVAATLVPLLTELLPHVSMFAVDICGTTSRGKTTALRVASSVWGSPKYMRTWDSTAVGVEHMASAMNGLPLLLDDTKRLKNPQVAASAVYGIVSNEGRARGHSDGGMREMAQYRTAIVSTGEAPLKDIGQHGGLGARCITLWGSPLGEPSHESAELARRLTATVQAHYGHIGKGVVEYLMSQTPEDRANWCNRYEAHLQHYTATAAPGDIGPRLSESGAALALAWQMLCEAMCLPYDPLMFEGQWRSITAAAETADRALGAMIDLHAHINMNPDRIYRPRAANVPDSMQPSEVAPLGGYLAHMARGVLSVPVGIAKNFLERTMGHTLSECVAAWNERGWLRTGDARRTHTVRIADRPVACYTFTALAMSIVAGVDDGTSSPDAVEPTLDDDVPPF
jgi:hypothetical protein